MGCGLHWCAQLPRDSKEGPPSLRRRGQAFQQKYQLDGVLGWGRDLPLQREALSALMSTPFTGTCERETGTEWGQEREGREWQEMVTGSFYFIVTRGE